MIDWGKVRAFIFDNDGVIVDSEPISCGALRQLFLEKYDYDIGQDFTPVLGTSDDYAVNYYSEEGGFDPDISEMIERKSEIYFENAEGNLSTFQDFHKLLRELSKRYSLAVASSGHHDKIKFSLEQVDASKYFPVICSATEVANGKPAPDLFIYTAECLGLPPSSCVVVEDSLKGVEGAKKAGMQVVGFASSFSEEDLDLAGADFTISDFGQLLRYLP